MYKHILLFFLILIVCPFSAASSLDVRATQRAKVPLMIGVLNTTHDQLQQVAQRLRDDLMFSGQFEVTVQPFEKISTKKEMQHLFDQGYPLAIFINQAKHDHAIEWRIYDTARAAMVKGKKYTKHGTDTNGWAHNIADAMWRELTGQSGFFSTKIAYCKQIKRDNKRSIKHICMADYDGQHEQVLVDTSTVNVVPRWNHDLRNPLVFYSEYTNANVRLMMVNMKKQRRIASNFDGINMLTSFSDDGKKVVYCVSRGDGSCQLYYHEKGIFKRLQYTDPVTRKSLSQGNNVSPTLTADGKTVFFCSDFLTNRPQVFAYDLATGQVERITDGGYCASPSYCAKKNCIAYIKRIDGVMQVCMYDIKTKKHTQLTQGPGNKDECSWSPCGNYILAAVDQGGNSRIAIYNLLTSQWRYVTPNLAQCDYPAWSPVYTTYPALVMA